MIYKLQFAELLPYWDILLRGLAFTIVLTIVSTVAGIALGTAGASARTFGPTWLNRLMGAYVELIRNTPFIVQLFFIFFGLPAAGLKLSETTAAFLAMTRLQVLRYVVLKQAFQKIYPALSSQIVIVMLVSAVVSQISAEDLTYAANFIQSRNFRAFEVYLVVAVLYLLLAVITRAVLRWAGRLVFPKA